MKKQLLYILGILMTLQVGVNTQIMSATRTWNGSVNTSWFTSGNWNGGVIADSTDIVIINSNAPNNLTLTQNHKIAGFTINGDTLDLAGYTLTITGTCTFNGGKTTTGIIKPIGTLCHFGGGVIDSRIEANCGYFRMNGSSFLKPTIIVSTSYASSTGTGNCVFSDSLSITHSGVYYFIMGSTNGDQFDGPVTIINSSTHEIYLATADTSYFNNNLIINNLSSGGVVFGNMGGVSYLASGKTISIGGSGFTDNYLTLKNFYQLGSTAQTLTLTGTAIVNCNNANFNGNLTVTAPGILLKNSTFNGTTTLTRNGSSGNFHSDGGNYFNGTLSLDNSSSVGRIRMASTTPDTYLGNVTFSSTGGQDVQIAYSGNNIFEGNLTINSNKVVFNTASGKVTFSGGNSQSLNGSYNYPFKKLAINKSANHVTANTTLSVDDTLFFVSKNLITTSANLLTMKAGSVTSGASNSSFVSGPVKKIGNSLFIFPIGKGVNFSEVKMSAPSTSTDAFIAEYFDTGQHSGENTDSSIFNLDDCNHWKILRSSGSSNIYLSLSWNSINCGISDTNSLRIVTWRDTTWKDLGHGLINGNYSNGNLTTNSTVSTYGYYTFAYDTNVYQNLSFETVIQSDGFIENIGQILGTDSLTNRDFLYFGKANNSYLFLGESTFSYVFSSLSIDSSVTSAFDTIYKVDSLYRLDMKIKGINSTYDIILSDTSQGVKNYFYGDTAYVNAHTFQNIQYNNIIRDIDLTFFNNDIYQFNINQNGDPLDIELYYLGSDTVFINSSGILNIKSKGGSKLYTTNAFEYYLDEWRQIEIEFSITDSIVSFNVGSHISNVPIKINIISINTSISLPIHPHNKLKWSTPMDGVVGWSDAFFNDVLIDDNDNVYLVGSGWIPDFPTFAGLYLLPIGEYDMLIVKFDSNRELVFSTYYGGENSDFGESLTVATNGDILIAGETNTPENANTPIPLCFPCTTHHQNNLGGDYDAFILKMNANGTSVSMATYFGGTV